MDSLLQFKPGDAWLLRSRGARAMNHLLAPAPAPRAATLPVFGRWRGRESLPTHLLDKLRESRANSAFACRLEDLQVCVARAEVQLRQLAVPQAWQVPGAGPVLGGDAMLASWHKMAEGGPLAREFATYACHVSACSRQLQQALASFDLLQQQARSAERLAPLCELAERLLAWGDIMVEDEVADEVMLRIQAYPELYEEMLDEGDGGSDEAAASLESLGDADLLRLDWAGGQRAKLLKTLAGLRAN
ncbi:hypothetical protein [Duganella sp. Root336D2]|uniref:hypothetical protein n=1 Tax=Duganella sp. Root336D2 TaxID=1736518 RepID=UPI0006F6C938|nr:hypothetical protein [Duganella sp. Root336D2]KQV46694.1 hypothetical protein ASD07_14670 [Duganella sp. Root336D2]